MMQIALAIACVVFAAGYLGRRAWKSLRGQCGGCGPAPKTPELISADELTARLKRR